MKPETEDQWGSEDSRSESILYPRNIRVHEETAGAGDSWSIGAGDSWSIGAGDSWSAGAGDSCDGEPQNSHSGVPHSSYRGVAYPERFHDKEESLSLRKRYALSLGT